MRESYLRPSSPGWRGPAWNICWNCRDIAVLVSNSSNQARCSLALAWWFTANVWICVSFVFLALIFMDDFNLVEFIILQQNRFRDNQCGCDANFIQKRRDEFQAELVSLVRKFIHQSLHKIIDPALTRIFSLENLWYDCYLCWCPGPGQARTWRPADELLELSQNCSMYRPVARRTQRTFPALISTSSPGRTCSGTEWVPVITALLAVVVLVSFRLDSVVTIKRCGACRRGCNWEFIHFIAACVVMA